MRFGLTPFLPALTAALWMAAAGFVAGAEERAPLDLYASGDFIEAGQAASAESTSADALALAAKAYAAAALLADDPAAIQRWGFEVRRCASEALALDPHHVEARLQLAIGLWLESRRRGAFDSYLAGLPQRGRALIEAARADAPDEAWAHAMLGAWHFEALRRGGRMAGRMLGADLAVGEAAFARAGELAPLDAAIPAQEGLAYLSMDPVRFHDQAAAALDRALSLTPRDAFEAAMQERARQARRLMDESDYAALEDALLRWLGG
jgi:hypothetical protein